MAALRVAVVGSCASGKSSVVACLRGRGFDAYAVGQEHSIIAALWRHLDPDRLVLLDVSLAAIQQRRDDPSWPQWIYDMQQERLRDARQHADIIVDTDDLDLAGVVEAIVARLDAGQP
jgi:hypothetical protein